MAEICAEQRHFEGVLGDQNAGRPSRQPGDKKGVYRRGMIGDEEARAGGQRLAALKVQAEQQPGVEVENRHHHQVQQRFHRQALALGFQDVVPRILAAVAARLSVAYPLAINLRAA